MDGGLLFKGRVLRGKFVCVSSSFFIQVGNERLLLESEKANNKNLNAKFDED
jgi:hypothetical protein